ncbi:protein containing response regulator domain, but no DNA binding domain [alpha proteobacterium BAL199]|jgi:DNA-binding response OmpR family regulator|nr:protein containing response regulator domain, but no DNA binding domain [alpha proteobacterium BAL199]
MGVSARVLIAEDEPNLIESLSFILGREGYEVSAVSDGDAVLERLRSDRPHVLILDVMLPKRTGFEVLKLIKLDPTLSGIPVMVLTAKGQERDRKTAEDLGADAFVTKPFSNQDVVDRIKRLAGG